MKIISKKTVAAAAACLLFAVWGCNGQHPLASPPSIQMSVCVAPSKDVQAGLLSSTSNVLLWSYQVSVTQVVHGQEGPFASGDGAGNIDFVLSLPQGGKRVLSLQLNDATTNLPLAVGAVQIDLSNPTPNLAVTLQLGSVNRQCYLITPTYVGSYYLLDAHSLDCSYTNADLCVASVNSNYQLTDPNNISSIAYLGNGNMVDFDYVPANDMFFPSSNTAKAQVLKSASGAGLDLQVGDIYCIKMNTVSGAYAWVQVSGPGTTVFDGPSFRFRVSTDPFFSYYNTTADTAQNCSTWGNCS